jgi:hypothetical protein
VAGVPTECLSVKAHSCCGFQYEMAVSIRQAWLALFA